MIKRLAVIFQSLPFGLFVYTVGNILYIAMLSVLPAEIIIAEEYGLLARLGLMVFSLIWLSRYYREFKVKIEGIELGLLAFYLIPILIRFPLVYPTHDDLAYHFMAGDYASRVFHDNNFMSTAWGSYFYPAVDLGYTWFLKILGIRWTIALLYLIISIWLTSIASRWRAIAKNRLQKFLLLVVFMVLPYVPHQIATTGTLMVDYFALVIVLEATYLATAKTTNKTLAALTMGMAILIKQSAGIFVLPIFLYYLWQNRRKINWLIVILAAGVSSLYFVRLYLETGNPVMGLYNGIFQSPLFPLSNFTNRIFGPQNIWQMTVWPIIGQFSDRFGEGMVAPIAKVFFAPLPILGYVGTMIMSWRTKSWQYVSVVLSYFLWSVLTGYSRYYLALNAIAVIMLVGEIRHIPKWFSGLGKKRYVILAIIAIGGASSLKTDLSWRPNPSIRTPAANAYFLEKYREGLLLLGRDTVGASSLEYRKIFEDNEAVIMVYRGPVTYVAYMAYLNGLPVVSGVTTSQYDSLLSSKKISPNIKNNLQQVKSMKKVILLTDNSYESQINDLDILKSFACQKRGKIGRDKYFQRDDYFGETWIYDCQKK
ncbi:MAG: hypothetical protein V1487_00445 [bacterium]